MKGFISSIIFLVFISIPFSLNAQDEVTLEPVVVTGTRDIQEIRKIPADVTLITKEEIQESNAKTVTDVLRDKADVVVRDFYGNGKSVSVDIRGFGETAPSNVLVLVDGRRVNSIDLSGVDWAQIPLDQVERIEIVRGSGSVLYGDNAVGGVVNIITKTPEKTFSANAEAAGGSYGYNRESASVGGRWGPLSAILNASHNSTEGYRKNGFLRAEDVGGKLIYDLNDAISFNFNGSFHRDDQGLPGALPENIYRHHRTATLAPDDHAPTDDAYGLFGMKAKLWDFGRIEADVSYRHREVDDFFISSSFKDQRNISTWGFTPKYILEKNLWSFRNKLIFGLDFYDSNSIVDSQSAFGPNRAKVDKRSVGLYALDEFSILENLILTFGGRNEWVTYDLFQESPFLDDKVRQSEPAWNVGLNYLFGKKSSAFLSVNRSFRFPASDELVQFLSISNNFVARVNPDMKPQVGYHYEAGIRHAFTDKIEAKLTLFWIDMKDEIFFNPLKFTNENLPKTRRQGVEVGAKVRPFQWLTVWGNYTYMKATLRSEPFSGNDLPGVPRNKGSVGADINLGRGFLFNTTLNVVGAQRFISDFANQTEYLDAYCTLDMKLTFVWKGLRAFVGVNNLFNQKYAEFGVVNAAGDQFFYASPKLNFIGGVSYTF
ncbi:MAG: TonB-dependent receptor [Thermodesulfobacteriota bacterium]